MDYTEFIMWATGPGINAIIGFIMSFAVELIPSFELLDAKVKRLSVLITCLVVPLIFTGLGAATGVLQGDINTWFAAFSAGLIAFGASTLAHTRRM